MRSTTKFLLLSKTAFASQRAAFWQKAIGTIARFFNPAHRVSRRSVLLLFLAGLGLSLALAACSPTESSNSNEAPAANPGNSAKVLRIGYQKFGTLNIVKAKGNLEKRLEPLGYSVEWTLFPAGPQLLEGLNVGSIDVGHTGEAPPIFAQAAGTPLVYIGNEPENPISEAILVPKNSNIQSVADLKGKKVALNKGSNVHYLLVKAIEEAGLTLNDIESVYMPPSDARVAFEQGSVDAWVIWDPFFAAAEAAGAKILRDGQGLVANREFYLGARSFAESNSQIVQALLDEIQEIDEWVVANPKQVSEILSPQIGIDASILEKVLKRKTFGVQPTEDEVIRDQQKIADTFYELKLIPKKLDVKAATLKS